MITYTITRGAHHKFVYLGLSGSRYFPEQTIRERLYIQVAEFPRFPYGRFSNSYLRQDIQSITALYRSNGFRDVKVSAKIQDDYRSAKNHLAVFIRVEEGRQWFVSELTIEGAGANDLPELRLRLESLKNQPFSEATVADDRDNC